MDPYQNGGLVFDNRPVTPTFYDGNPLTDGVANFASALINAPLQVAQIRKAKEAQDLEQFWRKNALDRQTAQDKLAQVWHDQATARQDANDTVHNNYVQTQMQNMKEDNSREFWQGLSKEGRSWVDTLSKRFFGEKKNREVRLADGSVVTVDNDGNVINTVGDAKKEKPIDVLKGYGAIQKALNIDTSMAGYDPTEDDKKIVGFIQSLGKNITPEQQAVLQWLQKKYQNSTTSTPTASGGSLLPWILGGVGLAGAGGTAYALRDKIPQWFSKAPVVNPLAPAAPAATEAVAAETAKVAPELAAVANKPGALAKLLQVFTPAAKALPFIPAAVEGVKTFTNDNTRDKISAGVQAAGWTGMGAGQVLPAATATTSGMGAAMLPAIPIAMAAGLRASAGDLENDPTDPTEVIRAYANGQLNAYPSMVQSALGALGTGETGWREKIADQRAGMLMHSIGAMLPPATTPQEQISRQALINILGTLANSEDPRNLARLRARLWAMFPDVLQTKMPLPEPTISGEVVH